MQCRARGVRNFPRHLDLLGFRPSSLPSASAARGCTGEGAPCTEGAPEAGGREPDKAQPPASGLLYLAFPVLLPVVRSVMLSRRFHCDVIASIVWRMNIVREADLATTSVSSAHASCDGIPVL